MNWPDHGSFNQVSSLSILLVWSFLTWVSTHLWELTFTGSLLGAIWEDGSVEKNASGVLAADGAIVKLSLIRHLIFYFALFCIKFLFSFLSNSSKFCRSILNTLSWRFCYNILAKLSFVLNFLGLNWASKFLTKYNFYHDFLLYLLEFGPLINLSLGSRQLGERWE